ncbi:hypothetical protein BH20CHL4_BH20CHL4_06160 [soil metagenome]
MSTRRSERRPSMFGASLHMVMILRGSGLILAHQSAADNACPWVTWTEFLCRILGVPESPDSPRPDAIDSSEVSVKSALGLLAAVTWSPRATVLLRRM